MPPIEHNPATGSWLLSTPATSYAFRLEPDALRHLYWGPRLTLAQLEATAPPPSPAKSGGFGSPWDGTEEWPAEGGPRFGVPSLQVRFADGARGVEWVPSGTSVSGSVLEIQLRDRYYPLGATLSYRVFDDCDVIERWVTLSHTGDGDPIEVFRLDSAAWQLPPLPAYRASYVTGAWAAETVLHRGEVPGGELTFTSRRGITSHHANPWVMFDDGTATETSGAVWSTVLAWSGSWRLTVSRADHVSVTGGFGHDGTAWTLPASSSLATPVLAGLYSSGGFGASSRAWHSYARSHVLPCPSEVRPVLFNSWEATSFDVNEANQLSLAQAAASIGCELFVVDDGWFGARTDDHRGLGDWTPNPARFPRGLRPLSEAVHALGMKFGVWVEPEMVNPDSDLYRAHPDWVQHFPHRSRAESRNQLVLDFARPDVAAWALDWLTDLVASNDVDFLKWDMNRPFGEIGGRLWLDHVRAVYALMDSLRSDFPALRIESCSGGGGRADFGIMARTDQVWTSDNTDAASRLLIQNGYGQVYPPGTMSAWVTDSPNPLTGRVVPLRFRFHVAMAGVLGVGGDLPRWSAAELAEATSLVAEYKSVREVIQHGSYFRLSFPGGSAVQYVLGSRAVVFAYRTGATFGPSPALPLLDLDPAGTYRVDDRTYSGAALLSVGLPIALPRGDYVSAMIPLTRELPPPLARDKSDILRFTPGRPTILRPPSSRERASQTSLLIIREFCPVLCNKLVCEAPCRYGRPNRRALTLCDGK
jgi:alpha-galactosidase